MKRTYLQTFAGTRRESGGCSKIDPPFFESDCDGCQGWRSVPPISLKIGMEVEEEEEKAECRGERHQKPKETGKKKNTISKKKPS